MLNSPNVKSSNSGGTLGSIEGFFGSIFNSFKNTKDNAIGSNVGNNATGLSSYAVQIYNANSNNPTYEIIDLSQNYMAGFLLDNQDNIIDPSGNIVSYAGTYQIYELS